MSNHTDMWVLVIRGIKDHAIGRCYVRGPFASREAASEASYFDQADEPSPDKHDYYRWDVVKVKP